MTSRTVLVSSLVGLHARPAARIAAAAARSNVPVHLSVEGDGVADAKSVLSIMSLGANCGTHVTVISEDAEAVTQIAQLIELGGCAA